MRSRDDGGAADAWDGLGRCATPTLAGSSDGALAGQHVPAASWMRSGRRFMITGRFTAVANPSQRPRVTRRIQPVVATRCLSICARHWSSASADIFPAQRLAWPAIERCGNGRGCVGTMRAEVGALRENTSAAARSCSRSCHAAKGFAGRRKYRFGGVTHTPTPPLDPARFISINAA